MAGTATSQSPSHAELWATGVKPHDALVDEDEDDEDDDDARLMVLHSLWAYNKSQLKKELLNMVSNCHWLPAKPTITENVQHDVLNSIPCMNVLPDDLQCNAV